MSTLSLCMIVKNEENWIETAIESVKSIVDEMIVVDTGSSDQTKQKALAMGAKLYDFPWCNDFAAARNYSLAQATSDWILVLDADETMDADGCQKIKTFINNPNADLAFLNQLTYTFESHSILWKRNDQVLDYVKKFPGYLLSPLIRVFKNSPDIQYRGVVHENPFSKINAKSINLNVNIHHFSLVRKDPKLGKREQYLKLAQKKCEQEPENHQAVMEYAIAYGELGRFAEGLPILETIMAANMKNEKFLVLIAGFYLAVKNYEKCENILQHLTAIQTQHSNTVLMLVDSLLKQKRNNL